MGQDGVTPQLKIENGKWHVSYDRGVSWYEQGQATGNAGHDGDAFFQNVDTTNPDYVTFVLADGNIVKVPTWSAFEALKKQCEQMNSNITALQSIVSAIQSNDYISSITPIYESDKEIGYIINFTKSGKVTIYHGKDGANGTDGKSPVVGVAKDTDGLYYWTVDGKWLVDANGQGVSASGVNGLTPQLKIENEKWYVSYNNGTDWTELGRATGEQGPQGASGVDGDAFFKSVTETKDYVSMVLSNGTEIRIPKYSSAAATLTLSKVTGFTATFDGKVVRNSLDLKVTVYYSTTDKLTVYKHNGKASVTEFNGDTFTLRLPELAANTTYYYFIEVVCDGATTFSEIDSFRTGTEDSYVDWGEGENIGGNI